VRTTEPHPSHASLPKGRIRHPERGLNPETVPSRVFPPLVGFRRRVTRPSLTDGFGSDIPPSPSHPVSTCVGSHPSGGDPSCSSLGQMGPCAPLHGLAKPPQRGHATVPFDP